MSWSRPPIARPSQTVRRQAEVLADLDPEGCDPASVLLGRGVLLRQSHHQGPHAGAEERLLGRHDFGCPKVAGKGTRSTAPPQVVGSRRTDKGDPDELEQMPEPPTQIHEGENHRAVQSS